MDRNYGYAAEEEEVPRNSSPHVAALISWADSGIRFVPGKGPPQWDSSITSERRQQSHAYSIGFFPKKNQKKHSMTIILNAHPYCSHIKSQFQPVPISRKETNDVVEQHPSHSWNQGSPFACSSTASLPSS